MLPIDADHAQRAMAVSYQAVTADLERLDEEDLARPSRCLGWTRADLLYHRQLSVKRLTACSGSRSRLAGMTWATR